MNKQTTVTVREARRADAGALAQLLEENNRPEVTAHFHPFPLNAETARHIACDEHLDRYYVALLGQRLVGLCFLRGWDEGYEIPSFGIFVDYRHHGLGLGRQMTEYAIAEAKRLGCQSVRLSVYENNVRAAQLYYSLGFRELSREPVLVAGRSGIKSVMVKDL